MIEVQSISHTILTDAERINLANRIVAIIEKVTVDQCPLLPEFTQVITTSTDLLDRAIGRTTTTSLTEKVNEADMIRDEVLDFIQDAIILLQKKQDEAIREAALLLKGVYEIAFSGINIKNNSEESVGIERFLEQLVSEEAIAALTTLGLTQEIETLKNSHTEYVTLLEKRAEVRENDDTPLLVPSRKVLQDDCKALISFIEFKNRQGSDLHQQITQEINSPIMEIMTVARSRATRKENN